MSTLPTIIPISALRQNAAGIIKQARLSREPVFVTQRGYATAVLLDAGSYAETQHELELLRVLARGESQIQAGVGHDLADTMAYAKALLASDDTAEAAPE
jgi:prevent-host-death family protein